MPVKIINKGGKAVIKASESLTVEQADSLHGRLRDALEGEFKSVVIDLSGATELDVSCLQVLCAAHKSAARRKVDISLSMMPALVEQAVSAAGFHKHEVCEAGINETCLWTSRESAETHGKI